MIRLGKLLAVIVLALAFGLFSLSTIEASADGFTPYQIYVSPDANEGEGQCVFTLFYVIPLAYETHNTNTTYAKKGTKINSTCHLDLSHYVDAPEMAEVLGEGEVSCYIRVKDSCRERHGRTYCRPNYEQAQKVNVVVTPSGKVNASCHAELDN